MIGDDGIDRPHFDGIPTWLQKVILADVKRRKETETGITPGAIERLGKLVRQFRIAEEKKTQPGDAA